MSADNHDPFALGGVPEDDSELFELIAEYDRREARANERGIDGEERARRCDDASEIREQIEAYRPTTLRGVLAIFELGSEPDQLNDPDFWPEEAIKGLRDILEREGRQ